ncbi:MAG: 16S rRNA (uracil(1498)-N(3))-methyltransferase [Clostridia bacterium]|nr:16S rRNA (uracil(1498)-N(3))-methyltransferase [Clostridia bacterium]
MPRFFIRAEQVSYLDNGARTITIRGEDAHHISRSLRMAEGEEITVCDMQKNVYVCKISGFSADEVYLDVVEQAASDTEPVCYIKLYQAIPKGDKLETIIQKSIECGVSEIIPFASERCIAKIEGKDIQKKAERHNKIAESAAKQSGRGIIPKVREAMKYNEALNDAADCDLMIFCYEGDNTCSLKEILRENKNAKTISLIIGSEGGFSLKEVELAKGKGAKIAGLGKRILRCETAPSFALACIAYETEL